MYYLDSNLLRPLTANSRLSYSELAGPRQVQWFVSHYWGSSFQHFVSAVQRHAEGTPDWFGPSGFTRRFELELP